MRKQIAAANWKMNLSYTEGEQLLADILANELTTAENHEVIIAVPFPYLSMALGKVAGRGNIHIAAQNCNDHKSGAYTGEVSVDMLKSIQVNHCVIGHSERREYYNESNQMIADKINLLLASGMTPIFCCGEPLSIREAETQNQFVEKQLQESLFHLSADEIKKVVIAYEPIWAIGTGKTASTEQAQEIHAYIRSVLEAKYGKDVSEAIPVLYGGSVKGSNAKELFSCADVDGGLVGGASLKADEFTQIINSLK